MKYIFYSVFLFILIPVKGQKINSRLVIPNDTSSFKIRLVCAPTEIKDYPLIIIDGRRFAGSTMQNLFLNVNDIESINVIGRNQDTIKYFGKSGQFGIIILNMKHPVVWISSKTIAKQKFSQLLISNQTLFEVDGKEFAPSEELYFAEGIIKTITVNNTLGYYADKIYQKKITIVTFK